MKSAIGTVFREEKCGCTIDGVGVLPDPWRVRYCLLHTVAPAMIEALRNLVDHVDERGTDYCHHVPHPWLVARVLLASLDSAKKPA